MCTLKSNVKFTLLSCILCFVLLLPVFASAAFAAVSAAFLLLSLVFIAPQTKRSPMALLGEKEE